MRVAVFYLMYFCVVIVISVYLSGLVMELLPPDYLMVLSRFLIAFTIMYSIMDILERIRKWWVSR